MVVISFLFVLKFKFSLKKDARGPAWPCRAPHRTIGAVPQGRVAGVGPSPCQPGCSMAQPGPGKLVLKV